MRKFALLTILLTLLILIKPAIATGKTLLFISQNFPQIPVKPLRAITPTPHRETVELGKDKNKIVADVFVPKGPGKNPGIIVAMGMRTNEKDKPILLNFSESLARLGYVVMWPRLESLDKDEVKVEQPETFLAAFQYLEKRTEVNAGRISFVGFSVGSSIAMLATEDPRINQKVHGLVFFGGYFNILNYLSSLATSTITVNNEKIPWNPSEDGINHAKSVLTSEGLRLEQFTQVTLPSQDTERILKYSPDQNLDNYKAKTFILHHREDPYVPYVESIKLRDALSKRMAVDFHLSNLFAHAQVAKRSLTLADLEELWGLFLFLHKIFMSL